jgi:hypothetical protein
MAIRKNLRDNVFSGKSDSSREYKSLRVSPHFPPTTQFIIIQSQTPDQKLLSKLILFVVGHKIFRKDDYSYQLES